MAQSPTLYCSRCRTTRPPLFARGSYSCVICGKTRNQADFRIELEELRLSAPPAGATPTAPKAPAAEPPPPKAAPAPPPKAAPAPTPKAQPEPAPKVTAPDAVICAWHECSNPARPKSKYCSRNCSNKNARWRHSKRDKA